jgi:hypothetical protein
MAFKGKFYRLQLSVILKRVLWDSQSLVATINNSYINKETRLIWVRRRNTNLLNFQRGPD